MNLANMIYGAGYALDTPRALAHAGVANLADYLYGRDKFQGWRASGRQMLDAVGVGGGEGLGTAAEFVLDPLNIAAGLGALTKGFKAYRAAKGLRTATKAAKVARVVAPSRATAMAIGAPTAGMGLMYANQEERNPYVSGLATALMAGPAVYGMAKYRPRGKKAVFAQWEAEEKAREAARAAGAATPAPASVGQIARKEIDFLEQRGIRTAEQIRDIIASARQKGISDLATPEGRAFIEPFIPKGPWYKEPTGPSVLAAMLGYNALARGRQQ